MPAKKTHTSDDREQSARFIKLAREVGADADQGAFDRTIRRIAAAPRVKPEPKRGRAKSRK